MALGYGDSVGYTALVKGELDINIDKGARFTDWSRRPLSEKQLNYAIGDVTHLRDLFPGMRAELAKRGRLSWVEEETAPMLSPDLYTNDPETAWERLKIRSNKTPYLAALKAAAAWREREAISRDIPRRRVLKDDALYAIAQSRPTTTQALGKIRGVPNGFERSRSAKKPRGECREGFGQCRVLRSQCSETSPQTAQILARRSRCCGRFCGSGRNMKASRRA